MPCNPSDNTINPPVIPPIPIPGFGIPIAPIQIPFPNLSLPTGLIPDLSALVNSLSLLFPSSTFKPTIDNFTKVIFDLIANLLTQIAPFLSFYNFIMALLNLIMCIIEIICALTNPFKLIPAIIHLFKDCLPPFMLMFPWLALIAIIIALLLLILALIEYLIATILAIIAEIIRNIMILANGLSFQDATATLAAIQKLAELMCLIQNIMAILAALGAIMAIIQALSLFGGGLACDDSSCCSPDVCPPFIKNAPVTGKTGQLTYSAQVGADAASIFAGISGLPPGFDASIFNIPPVRTERWQLVDVAFNQYPFSSIITPAVDPLTLNVTDKFWPEGISFTSKTPKNKACYTCDVRVVVDPNAFGIADAKGARHFRINDCIVVREPYIGLLDYQENLLLTNLTGTLNLEGGLVFEDDGKTPYMVAGKQATLNTFIHKPDQVSVSAPSNDLLVFNDIEYSLKPGYGALMGYQLITAGCIPDIRVEKAVFNAVLASEDVRAVFLKLQPTPAGKKVPSVGVLPNVQGAQDCVINALSDFRKDVTLETAAIFQANVETCLGDLRDQTLAAICGAIIAAVSQFKSTATLSTDIEFTTRPITVNVLLKDPVGTNVGLNIPPTCVPEVEARLKGEVTLGEISKFTYDGASSFNAFITSKEPGHGKLNVLFDGKVFSTFVPGTNGASSQITENTIDYTFIDAVVEPIVRRDNTDKE